MIHTLLFHLLRHVPSFGVFGGAEDEEVVTRSELAMHSLQDLSEEEEGDGDARKTATAARDRCAIFVTAAARCAV